MLDGGRNRNVRGTIGRVWALWGSVETETTDAIEPLTWSSHENDVSRCRVRRAAAPAERARVAPRVADDLVSCVADDVVRRLVGYSRRRRVRRRVRVARRGVGWWPVETGDGEESVPTADGELMPLSSQWSHCRPPAARRRIRRPLFAPRARGAEGILSALLRRRTAQPARIRRGDETVAASTRWLETLVRDELRGVRRRVWRELRRGREVPRVLLHAGERDDPALRV